MYAKSARTVATLILASAFTVCAQGWRAQAQPSAQQVQLQAQTQTRINYRIRELSQQAVTALINDDCGTFTILTNKLNLYASGDPVGAFRDEAPGAAGMRLTSLSDYQIGEIGKYANNRFQFVHRRKTEIQAQRQASQGLGVLREEVCPPDPWFLRVLSSLPVIQPQPGGRLFNLPGTNTCIELPAPGRNEYAAPDPETARRVRLRREAEKAFAQGNGIAWRPQGSIFDCIEFDFGTGFQQIDFAHTRYLGSSDGATDRLGLLHVGDRMRGWYIEWMTNVHLASNRAAPGFFSGGFIQFGVFGGAARSSNFFDTFDPGANNRTLLPGAAAGGVSLGGWPLNIGRDINYRSDLSDIGFRFGYGKRYRVTPNTTIAPLVFGTVSRLNFSELLSLTIPGFGRDALYNTDIDVTRWGVGGGFAGETSLGSFTFGNNSWNTTLQYSVEIGGMWVSASGQDSLEFTGLPTSQQHLDRSTTDWSAKLTGGVLLNTRRGLSIGFQGGYERRPGYPSIERTGNDPATVQFNAADILSGRVAIRLTLDAEGRLVGIPFDPYDDDY
jgi:hypothetical protein